MRTVFITTGEDIIARNIIETDFWPELLRRMPEARFVMLVQPERAEYFRERFGSERVVVRGYKRAPARRLENTVMSLARSGLDTHTNLWSKMRSYYRGHSNLLATWFKRAETATLGNSRLFKRALRRIILRLPPDAEAEKLFEEYRPDALLALSLANFEFDVPLARSARARGVRLLGMVRSWDNLSSHGLLRVVPDVFFFQNEFLKTMARGPQAIGGGVHTSVVGLPHYDAYFDPKPLLMPRAEFLERGGLAADKKTVLYGAMGTFLFIHENEMVSVFDALAESESFGTPAQVLYRAHPKFKIPEEIERGARHVVLDRGGSYLKTQNNNESADKWYINSLYHSDCIVTTASTVALDALALGKPAVCIAFDGTTSNVRYWESAARFYDQYTHYEALVETGVLRIARSKEELARHITAVIGGAGLDGAAAKRAKDLFIEPFDGKAGERLAEKISNALSAAA